MLANSDCKRIAIYHHFDKDDLVDDYVVTAIKAFHDFGCRIIFVSNSAPSDAELAKLAPYVVETILRPNKGYDFAGWKQVLLSKGREFFAEYDELVLLNSTFYGPFFPLEEMFGAMADAPCDFWAPTAHSEVQGIPAHIQPYVLVVRRRLHQHDAFWNYWESILEEYHDLWSVVWHGEIRLTLDWKAQGFTEGVYADIADKRELRELGYYEPYVLHAIDQLVRWKRLPFAKVKAFYKYEGRAFTRTRHFFKALDMTGSTYPRELIERHQRRVSPLSWQKNLPSTLIVPTSSNVPSFDPSLRIGVFGHFFYPELLAPALAYLKNIPHRFDLFVTTSNQECAARIETLVAESGLDIGKVTVKAVENRGRDIAPWLIEFRDEHLSYDIALKLHTKRHSQQTEVFGLMWNEFMYETLLQSPAYVGAILDAFVKDPAIGIAFPTYPPLYNMIHPEGYYGSGEDQAHRQAILDRLGVAPPPENCQPVFSAGGMSWYRPQAMRRLLEAGFTYDEFPAEPFPMAGTIGHGLERVIPYVAQADGFSYRLVMPMDEMLTGFQMYEDRSMSFFDKMNTPQPSHPDSAKALFILIVAMRNAYHARFPRMARATTRMETKIHGLLKKTLGTQATTIR